MSLSRKLIPLLTGIIFILSIFYAGCIANSPTNTSLQQISPTDTVYTQTSTMNPATLVVSTTIVPDTIIIASMPSPEPIFTETGRPMTDANGTLILSKTQAWSYAEMYLETRGLTNIQQAEVKAHEPDVFIDKVDSRESLWIFEINRKDSMGIEQGGIIAINIYDGHVVWYAALT